MKRYYICLLSFLLPVFLISCADKTDNSSEIHSGVTLASETENSQETTKQGNPLNTKLLKASSKGDTKEVESLLNQGADINTRSNNGYPLYRGLHIRSHRDS